MERLVRGDDVMCLNVGGTKFYCSRCTLATAKNSYFDARFSSFFNPGGILNNDHRHHHPSTFASASGSLLPGPDACDCIPSPTMVSNTTSPTFFIDRDPQYFPYILQFLRDQQTELPRTLLPYTPDKALLWDCLHKEADFYCLTQFQELLDQAKQYYTTQEFPFRSDGKGVLHYLGTNKGTEQTYVNPYNRGLVHVHRSTDPGQSQELHWSEQDLISGTDKARASYVSYRPLFCELKQKPKRKRANSRTDDDADNDDNELSRPSVRRRRNQANEVIDNNINNDANNDEADGEDEEIEPTTEEERQSEHDHEICVPYTADVFSCCLYDGRITDHGMSEFYVTLELPKDMMVRPSHYSLRHSGINCPCGMESWDFLGSADGKKWDRLHESRRVSPINLDAVKESIEGSSSGLMELLGSASMIGDGDLNLLAQGLLERTRRTFKIDPSKFQATEDIPKDAFIGHEDSATATAGGFYRFFRIASIPRESVPRDIAPCMHGAGLELFGEVREDGASV